MQRNVFFLLAAIFLCFQTARAQQGGAAVVSPGSQNQIAVTPAPDCDLPAEPRHVTEQIASLQTDGTHPQSSPFDLSAGPDPAPNAVDLERDLSVLAERQSALAQCILATDVPNAARDFQGGCSGQLLLNFEMRHDGEPEKNVPIGRLAGTSAFFFESGMTIDADGAPNAYHPDNLGLDDLANAGAPGRWEGLAKDAEGQPIIQGPDDPFPGYYISATALADHSKALNDPTRYVDASKIPFVVLPGGMNRQIGARPGDFAVVFNQRNGKSSYAIFGDVGPFDRIGEGSMALADNLGVRSDARNGGAHRGILYLVFPGSGNGRPRTIEQINSQGQKLLLAWQDGVSRGACTAQLPERTQERNQATD